MKKFFIGFGSQKSGSTWLWEQLQKHPECDLPPYKEIHYFSRFPWYPTPSHLSLPWHLRMQQERFGWGPGRGINKVFKRLARAKLGGNHRLFDYLYRYHFSSQLDDQWYLSLFKDYCHSLTGEITPAYSFLHSHDINNIVKLIPDVKFIYIVRDPFEQALSSVRHIKSKLHSMNALVNATSYNRDSSNIINNIASLVMSDTFDTRLNHGGVMRRLVGVVGSERVLLLDNEMISKEPSRVAVQLADFLNISISGFDLSSMKRRIFVNRNFEINHCDMPIEYLLDLVQSHSCSAPSGMRVFYEKWIANFKTRYESKNFK